MTNDKAAEPGLDVLAMARAAGLDQAVRRFPDDVAAAAQAAAQDRDDLPEVDGATAEPWPPMRIRSRR